MTKTASSTTPQLRVAAYCRITSDSNKQDTILDAQRDHFTERINANPAWVMAGIFSDIGDSRSKRPEFQKMLRKCRQKKIDLILARSISQFARNYMDCRSILQNLRKLGIAVIFEKENISTLEPDFDMYISIMGAIIKTESESLTHRTCTGHYLHTTPCVLKKGIHRKTIRFLGHPPKTIIFRVE